MIINNMYLSIKIWLIAQLLHAIGSLLVFHTMGYLLMVFGALFGLPAILLYWVVMGLLQEGHFSGKHALAVMLVAAPICTSLCVWGALAYFELMELETHQFYFIPLIATAVSVAFNSRSIIRLITSNKE